MAVHLKFSFFGEAQVDRTLLAYAERAADMRPAWDLLEDRFRAYEQAWFDSEGDGRWPQLSRSYGAWKAKHYPGRKILVREGDLRASVLKPDISVKEPGYAIFGTGDPVASYHQRGDGHLPVRKVIDLDDTEREEWVRTVQGWLAAGDDTP